MDISLMCVTSGTPVDSHDRAAWYQNMARDQHDANRSLKAARNRAAFRRRISSELDSTASDASLVSDDACASPEESEPLKSPPWSLLRVARDHARGVVFSVCCLFVMAVSVHDAMLVLIYRHLIEEFERNPVGRWLLDAHGGELWLFLSAKLGGTAVVCAILITLYEHRRRLAFVIAGGLTLFQIILLWYLSCR